MLQVFVNLIRNAVDAVRRGGADSPERGVAVSAEGVERDGVGWICVRVSDDGRGIDPEMLPTLFEPFVSDTLDARGTGLGLAVAEGIVREHGGTLIARNRAHRRGAVFEIMMPRCRPESRPEGRGEAPTVTGPGADTSDTDSGEPARMESPE
jgi:signal transduction histidine kinase